MSIVASSSSNHAHDVPPIDSPVIGRPLSRCTKCSPRHNPNSRNIVVCIDGTSNYFGQNNTNIVKLFAKVDLETGHPQPKQFAYYSSGIGTRPKSLHVFSRMERAVSDKFDMAIAWNMEEIVKDAYGWLARTYQEGDQIYLFGFSRGAYQVRVLAGMIREVGLIRTPTEKQIGTAWDYYRAIRSGKPKPRQIAREFKNTFSWKDMRVHFVGVWDTVSSVGLIREDVFLSTSASAAHACHFRHALALDELRVKFMPEYFHEMNSQSNDSISKYIVQKNDVNDTERLSSPVTESDKSTMTPEVKEVWFAGTHSDVGGTNRPGKSYQAGNVSLLWMRREAAACGLVLRPTDIVWVPDDLDFGTINSMTRIWRMVEYLPIKHQVSFSGTGEDARRWHRLHPRRIIPGQKVHASILFANAYRPRATLGEGFDIPVVHAKSADTPELDEEIWDTGMFDDTAARELLAYLGSQQGVAPIYLDRLLFMLRFKEGRECVRQVSMWRETFEGLIENCGGLVRLVTIVAYYEAAFDEESDTSGNIVQVGLRQGLLDDAKASFRGILAARKHRDCPRVVALLRPLTRHQALRQHILTPDVLQIFVELLDRIISSPGANFAQAIDGLDCLLNCEELQGTLIGHLGLHPRRSRLARMLDVTDLHHLTACLRVVVTLSRMPEARDACTPLKPKLRELAAEHEVLTGTLAAEALVALFDPNDEEHLSAGLTHPNFRANIASTLLRLNPDDDRSSSNNELNGYQILRQLFGLDAENLSEPQKKLIGELKTAMETGKARERTAATMTLLKLSETSTIRAYLCEIDVLIVFIDLLQYRNSALLAAYALATCLKYSDLKESIKDNEDLPKYIVGMLRLDYFDDAVGQVEGFQIFGDIMQHADLREKIKDYNITEVLNEKLGAGKPKEIRTSLICLDIFRSFDPDGPWTRELVAQSLDHLQNVEWKVQKAGVTILSALAQTDHGSTAIKDRLSEIVEMLLPAGYLLLPSTSESSGGTHATEEDTAQSSQAQILSPESPSKPPSSILGPACALRILAQNKTLRERMRDTLQYGSLKHLHLSGNLINEADTSPWRVKTPNRADVVDMLDKMIKAVDEELLEEGLMSIGDTVLPHIQHWDRLAALLRDRAVTVLTILPLVLGVSALTVVAIAMVTPVYLSFQTYKFFRRLVSRYQHTRILDKLRGRRSVAAQGGDQGTHGENQEDHGSQEIQAIQGDQEVGNVTEQRQ